MYATNGFLRSLGVEIYDSGQRRWPDEVKAQAVAESLQPGATVNAMAAQYGIQVFVTEDFWFIAAIKERR